MQRPVHIKYPFKVYYLGLETGQNHSALVRGEKKYGILRFTNTVFQTAESENFQVDYMNIFSITLTGKASPMFTNREREVQKRTTIC